jgi:CheY-like chemotaxis protein
MSSFRILVVDDQRDVRRMVADALQMLGPGMDIVELPSGEEALLVAFRKQVHLLITDIKLPGISGLDLVRRIRKNNPDLKIIMITGLTDPDVKEQVDQIEADAFFYKPVGAEKLLDAAQKCLGIVEGEPAFEAKEEPATTGTDAHSEITKPVAVKTQEDKHPGLVTALGTLRDQLKAQAVALIDAQGQTVSQVGDITLLTDSALVSRLLTTLQNSLEVSSSLSQGIPSSLLCFSGAGHYLCVAPVGTSQALLVVGGQAFQASLLSPGRRITATAGEIQKLSKVTKEPEEMAEMEALSAEESSREEVLEEAKPEDLAAAEALFSHKAEEDMKATNLDDFWGSMVENNQAAAEKDNGFLSYDEARKMGLTPD